MEAKILAAETAVQQASLNSDEALRLMLQLEGSELCSLDEAWCQSFQPSLESLLHARLPDEEAHIRRLVDAVRSFGERLRDDPTLRARVDGWIASTAVEVVERSKGEVGDVIASTVARWDATDATERIELQVGRDLQFIRINGTVVGGLVGLLIYTVGQLLG